MIQGLFLGITNASIFELLHKIICPEQVIFIATLAISVSSPKTMLTHIPSQHASNKCCISQKVLKKSLKEKLLEVSAVFIHGFKNKFK